ncbi:hypothetical protein H2199_004493 [Coniosporium tulheliwenetii]|uniref:Uncharacterized protein n=1 Tax=Coniosporium tulheliwenetii TaxID=3383036 RepID=A0ACC2Z5Y9_9PEZI|nr:hypothetical protein H2199_004493 [Cladosporium sp. JES 115]
MPSAAEFDHLKRRELLSMSAEDWHDYNFAGGSSLSRRAFWNILSVYKEYNASDSESFVCFAYRQAGTPVISVINPAAIIYKVMWNLSRAAVWVKLVSFGLAFLVTFLATLFIARKVACLVSAITSRLRPANVALNSADPGSTGAVPEPEAEDDAIAVVREHITRKWERFEGVWYMFLFAEIVVITFGSHFFNVDGVLWTTLVDNPGS